MDNFKDQITQKAIAGFFISKDIQDEQWGTQKIFLLKLVEQFPNEDWNWFFSVDPDFAALYSYLFPYVKDLDDSIIKKYKKVAGKKGGLLRDCEFVRTYIETKCEDTRLTEIVENIAAVFLEQILNTRIFYTLAGEFNFKSYLLAAFKNNQLHDVHHFSSHSTTRTQISRLFANYLFLYNKEKGEEILRMFEDEVEFVQEMYRQREQNITQNSEQLYNFAKDFLQQYPTKSHENQPYENIFVSFTFERSRIENGYTYYNHNQALHSAMDYYCHYVNSDIIAEFTEIGVTEVEYMLFGYEGRFLSKEVYKTYMIPSDCGCPIIADIFDKLKDRKGTYNLVITTKYKNKELIRHRAFKKD